MSRKLTFLALFVGVVLWLANSMNPPNGKTNAPGDGTCSECHSLNGGLQDGSVVVSGLPSTIVANTGYVLTITASNPNGMAVKAGFQMTVLNSNNQKAGSMSGPSMFSVVTNSGTRQYWEHNPAQNFPANDMVQWTVTWTAPPGPDGTTITAYSIANIADGSNDTSGDLITTSQASGTLMGAPALVVEIVNSTNVTCNGGNNGSATAAASGGAPPYSYHWSNGSNNATANNLSAGNYTVTATDNGGTTATAVVNITQPAALVFQTPIIQNVLCNGQSNGSITASATGGFSPYSYSWSTGANGSTISNLAAGAYTVTVTDDNGCTKTATYNVTQPGPLDITLVTIVHESCAGQNNGSITISISGGVVPFFAEWSNGDLGTTITGLSPDTYTVTVTDNNNCTETATYTINPGGSISVDLIDLHPVSCHGGNDGSINVMAVNGTPPYMYAWSNGSSGNMITGLMAGNYLLTATDAHGCETVRLYAVSEPPAIAVPISQSGTNNCSTDMNVNLTANPSGGSGPYSGTWSTGATGLTLNGVGAGTYTLTVTDATGCTSTGSSVVTAPAALTVSVVTTDETAPGNNDGTATANAGGGTAPYTYAWSNGSTTQVITGLAPGMYSVTVTDMNGCAKTASGQVDVFGCMLSLTLGDIIVICENDTLQLTPTITGETGMLLYSWSTGDTTSAILVSSSGEYCLTVTDEAGCQDADCVIVGVNVIPPLNCTVTNESAPGANDGAIQCDTIAGIATYIWSNGATTPSISGLGPGDYCLTVTDIVGCTKTGCFTVLGPGCNLVVTALIADEPCHGDSLGTVAVNVENATLPVAYVWSDGDTTSSKSNLPAGAYAVTVTDGAGCTFNAVYTVTEPELLTITLDSVKSVTDIASGKIFITVSGGVPPYMYFWAGQNGYTSHEEDPMDIGTSGFFDVAVRDANNCLAFRGNIFVDMDVAVDPVAKPTAIKVYPVPARDKLFIDVLKSISDVSVYSADGRLMMQLRNLDRPEINVSALEPGLYFLRLSDGVKNYVARFVK